VRLLREREEHERREGARQRGVQGKAQVKATTTRNQENKEKKMVRRTLGGDNHCPFLLNDQTILTRHTFRVHYGRWIEPMERGGGKQEILSWWGSKEKVILDDLMKTVGGRSRRNGSKWVHAKKERGRDEYDDEGCKLWILLP